MHLDELHPLDVRKVECLAEQLCDVAAGRRLTREDLLHDVEMLLICTMPSCSADGAEDVLDRLLAAADDRLGREGMAIVILDALATVKAASDPRIVIRVVQFPEASR